MTGTVTNIKQRNEFANKVLSSHSFPYHWEWSKIKKIRSLSQNALMWLIFTHISFETGNDKMDLYLFCLDRFPTFKDVIVLTRMKLVQITSSQFNTAQMKVFIDNIYVFFRSEGFKLPDPEDQRILIMSDFYRSKGLL